MPDDKVIGDRRALGIPGQAIARAIGRADSASALFDAEAWPAEPGRSPGDLIPAADALEESMRRKRPNGGIMPVKRGRGRYFLAAILLALEAPILSVLAIGAGVSRAWLAARRATQLLVCSVRAPAVDSPERGSAQRARGGIPLGRRR